MSTAPCPRGRPRSAARTEAPLGLRLTSEQRRAVDAAAQTAALDTSTWIREVILRAAGRPDLGLAGALGRVDAAVARADLPVVPRAS